MIHRELYFATPVYIKDVGTPEYNQYLEEKIKTYQTHRSCPYQDPKVASRFLNQNLGL